MSDADLMSRLLARSVSSPDSDCLLWTGYISKAGWGGIKYCGIVLDVHRAMWIAAFGEIPEGECVLHTCHVQHCINERHLFRGTRADKVYHMIAAGRRRSGSEYGSRKRKTIRRWGKKPVDATEMYAANKAPT